MEKFSQLFGDAGSNLAELLVLFNEDAEVASIIVRAGHIRHNQSDVDVTLSAAGPDLNFSVVLSPNLGISIFIFTVWTLELHVLPDLEAVLVNAQTFVMAELDVQVFFKHLKVGHEHLGVVSSLVWHLASLDLKLITKSKVEIIEFVAFEIRFKQLFNFIYINYHTNFYLPRFFAFVLYINQC